MIYDDLELPVGKVKLQSSGRGGMSLYRGCRGLTCRGHNGIRSILEALQMEVSQSCHCCTIGLKVAEFFEDCCRDWETGVQGFGYCE